MTTHGKKYAKIIQNANKAKQEDWTTSLLNTALSLFRPASSNQNIFTIVPKKYDYENSDGLCRQICLFNSELFFNSNSFGSYAKSITGTLKGLSGSKSFSNSISSYTSANVLSNYEVHSKFIKGEDTSLEIMRFIQKLQNNQKASVIFTIGGHSVSLVLQSHNGKVNLAYYDSYFGQVYVQTIMQSEVDQALKGEGKFTSPISILNPDNILIGRAIIRDDSTISTNLDISLISFITKTKTNSNIDKITISEKTTPEEVIKYLALAPTMLYNVKQATNTEAFHSFIKKYGSDLIKQIKLVKECASLINDCSDSYLQKVTSPPYDGLSSDEIFIREIMSGKYSRVDENQKKSPLAAKQAKSNSEICVENTNVEQEVTPAETRYFKYILQEKERISEFFHKCIASSKITYKQSIAKELCKRFDYIDPNVFSRLSNNYYDTKDDLKKDQDMGICFSDSKIAEILGNEISTPDEL